MRITIELDRLDGASRLDGKPMFIAGEIRKSSVESASEPLATRLFQGMLKRLEVRENGS